MQLTYCESDDDSHLAHGCQWDPTYNGLINDNVAGLFIALSVPSSGGEILFTVIQHHFPAIFFKF